MFILNSITQQKLKQQTDKPNYCSGCELFSNLLILLGSDSKSVLVHKIYFALCPYYPSECLRTSSNISRGITYLYIRLAERPKLTLGFRQQRMQFVLVSCGLSSFSNLESVLVLLQSIFAEITVPTTPPHQEHNRYSMNSRLVVTYPKEGSRVSEI